MASSESSAHTVVTVHGPRQDGEQLGCRQLEQIPQNSDYRQLDDDKEQLDKTAKHSDYPQVDYDKEQLDKTAKHSDCPQVDYGKEQLDKIDKQSDRRQLDDSKEQLDKTAKHSDCRKLDYDKEQLDKTAKHSDCRQLDDDKEQLDKTAKHSDCRQLGDFSEQSENEKSEAEYSHHPTSTALSEAARGTADVAKAGEGKTGSRWRCPLDMGSFGGAVVGGLVVFGLSFITPWINYSDPVCNVDPPWDISLNENVTQHADMRIEEAVGNVKDSLNASLQARIQEALWKQNDTLEKMEQRVNVSLHECVRVNNIFVANAERRLKVRLMHNHKIHISSCDHLRNLTLEKFGDLQQSQELVYDFIKGMGFMRSDSWGLLMIVMGVMEVILYVFICVSFNNRRPRHPDVIPPAQMAPPPQVDQGDRNTLCVVCFVDRDVDQIHRWTEEIVRETRASQRMCTLTHVIASRRDIQSVPTCRLALVFVNPDERQLILEDVYHMGSTRRETVEAVRRKGAEIILIAYDDPRSSIPILATGKLYDPSLTQVTSHPVLRDLNNIKRVLSVKESFSEFQKRHLIDSIDQIFT